MNKYITMLLLGVVIVAMALVVGVHMKQFSDEDGKEESTQGGQPSEGLNQPVGGGRLAPPDDAAEGSAANPAVASGETGQAVGGQTGEGTVAGNGSGAQAASSAGAGGVQSGQSVQPGQADQTGQIGPAASSSAAQSGEQPGATASSGGTGASAQSSGQSASQGSSQSGVAQGGSTPGASSGSALPAQSSQPAQAVQTGENRGDADKSASVARGRGSMKVAALKFRGNGMYLLLEGDSALPAKYFLLHSPERLVVDLPGAWKNLATPGIPSNQLIKSIRVGRQSDADRLVIDLSRKLKNHELIRVNDRTVEIFFE